MVPVPLRLVHIPSYKEKQNSSNVLFFLICPSIVETTFHGPLSYLRIRWEPVDILLPFQNPIARKG